MFRHYLPSIAATVALLAAIVFVPVADRIQQQRDLRGQVVSAQSIVPGDGLTGTYFQSNNCSGSSKTQVDPVIDFDNDGQFGSGFHDPCIRWTGQLYVEGGSGNYTFYVASDDGVVLRINNQLVIDDRNCHSLLETSGSLNLEDKKRYDIDLEYFDCGGPGIVDLQYSGPGISRQLVPQRVLYSTRTQCSDSVDNDSDGQTDFGNDPGCESAHDDDETNPACNDGLDNDGDGPIDHPADPGCDSPNDNDEFNDPFPLCSDGEDNDGDGRIDFPSDPGCTSADDTDENDPSCSDGLDNDGDGRIDFPEDPGCDSNQDTDETSPECADGLDNDGDGDIDFDGGDRGCDNLRDPSEENPPIDRNVGSQLGVGVDFLGPNQYLPSFLANENNNYAIRAPSGSSFELVNMEVENVYNVNSNDLMINGEAYFHLLRGTDRNGKEHIALVLGRYWDANTLEDPGHTPEPYHTFFQSRGSIASCISGLQQIPSPQSYFEDRFSFQVFLDIFTICVN